MSSSSSEPLSSSSESVTYTRGIRLRRLTQVRFQHGAVDGYRFQVVAHDAYLMPNEIFRYVREPKNPRTGEEQDSFDGVCSPADLEEYPIAEPSTTSGPRFMRLAEIDLVFRSQHLADEAWTILQEEVASLVATLDIMDNLEETEDVTIGSPPS